MYQLARDVEIDPSLLGTRNDIEALISGDMNSKLATGWRAEVVGGCLLYTSPRPRD